MASPSLSSLRERIAAIWQEASASGCNLEDFLPQEVQDHFQILQELRVAREYIRETASREEELKRQNENLATELAEERKKVNELPEEHQQALVDLKQAENRIEFFQTLMVREEQRAEDYKARWTTAQKMQNHTEDLQKRLETAHKANEQYILQVKRLVEANEAERNYSCDLKARMQVVIEEKDAQVQDMITVLEETDKKTQQVMADNDDIERAYNELVSKMEDDNCNTTEALNYKTEKLQSAEALRVASFSEIMHLNRCLQGCVQAVGLYQNLFKAFVEGNGKMNHKWLPEDLDLAIERSAIDCAAFKEVHAMINDQGIERDEVRDQLAQLGGTAEKMQLIMEDVAVDFDDLLEALKRKPNMWSQMSKKLSAFRETKSLSCQTTP